MKVKGIPRTIESTYLQESYWLIDSGANINATQSESKDKTGKEVEISTVAGTTRAVSMKNLELVVKADGGHEKLLTLQEVVTLPNTKMNIICTSELMAKGWKMTLDDQQATLTDPDKDTYTLELRKGLPHLRAWKAIKDKDTYQNMY